MPVMPRSSRPVHLYEADSFRGLHDIRIALHVLSSVDKRHILDKAGRLSIEDFENYASGLVPELKRLLDAYTKLREGVAMWRLSDNEEGSKEYVI
jgi:hypothetical protein